MPAVSVSVSVEETSAAPNKFQNLLKCLRTPNANAALCASHDEGEVVRRRMRLARQAAEREYGLGPLPSKV